MAKPSDFPGFKALQKRWYEKLRESGFKDLEANGEGTALNSARTEGRYMREDPVTRETRIEYFSRIQGHVMQTQFKNDREREILSLYAQGVPQAMIQRVLGIEGNRCKVNIPIYKWLRHWGLK